MSEYERLLISSGFFFPVQLARQSGSFSAFFFFFLLHFHFCVLLLGVAVVTIPFCPHFSALLTAPCFAAASPARRCAPSTWSSWPACLMGGSRSRNPPSRSGPPSPMKPSPSPGTDGCSQFRHLSQVVIMRQSCDQAGVGTQAPRSPHTHTHTHCWFVTPGMCLLPGLEAAPFRAPASIPPTRSPTRCSTSSKRIL